MAAKKKERRLLTKAIDKNKVEADEIMLAWNGLLQGRHGELIRADLENEIMATSFSHDPYVMAYNEGYKDFARRILLATEMQEAPKVRKNLDFEERDREPITVKGNLV